MRVQALPIRVSPSKTPLQTARREGFGAFDSSRGRRRRSRFPQHEHAVYSDTARLDNAIIGADCGQPVAC